MAMNREWILQTREARRTFANATWVPLRAYRKETIGQAQVTEVGYVSEVFACGSVAFPPEHREVAEQLGWSDLGIDHAAQPYAYDDGHYEMGSIEFFNRVDSEFYAWNKPLHEKKPFDRLFPYAEYKNSNAYGAD